MGGIEGEEEKMEERVEELHSKDEKRICLEGNTNFLEDDRLLTALLESTSESRSGRIRGSFGTLGGRRRRRRELVSDHDFLSFLIGYVLINLCFYLASFKDRIGDI